MSRRALHAPAVALVAGGLVAAPGAGAHVQPKITGLLCGIDGIGNATYLSGGPLAVDVPGLTISMRCSLQVGAANSAHSAADFDSVSSPATPQVTVLPHTLVDTPPSGTTFYICSEATIGTTTYYYDDTAEEWSASSSVPCDEYRFGGDVLEDIDALVVEYVDPVICPALAVVFPPEGDVPLAWNCPPYGT